MNMLDYVLAVDGGNLNISLEEFAAGLKSLKHKARIDMHGISLDALM